MPPKPVATPKSGIRFIDMTAGTPLVTGFRMIGRYAAASGLTLEFNNASVTLTVIPIRDRSPSGRKRFLDDVRSIDFVDIVVREHINRTSQRFVRIERELIA
jgi:hypothetical protein